MQPSICEKAKFGAFFFFLTSLELNKIKSFVRGGMKVLYSVLGSRYYIYILIVTFFVVNLIFDSLSV